MDKELKIQEEFRKKLYEIRVEMVTTGDQEKMIELNNQLKTLKKSYAQLLYNQRKEEIENEKHKRR